LEKKKEKNHLVYNTQRGFPFSLLFFQALKCFKNLFLFLFFGILYLPQKSFLSISNPKPKGRKRLFHFEKRFFPFFISLSGVGKIYTTLLGVAILLQRSYYKGFILSFLSFLWGSLKRTKSEQSILMRESFLCLVIRHEK